MSKIRKSILIIGILVIVVAASLATALALLATGSIKTDPIELEFVLKEKEKVYDGTPLKLDDAENDIKLTKGELLAGHTMRVEFSGEQTGVGVSTADATVKIYDKDGFNVTSDYSVKVESSTLTVHKKSISVDMPAQKVVYNGSKVLFNDYEITKGNLVNGHKIYGSTEAGLMNVGDSLPEDLAPLVFDVAGNDVTANYEIEFTLGEEGAIEVIPRPLAVRPVSYEKIYDGSEIFVDGVEYLNDTTLVEGQYIKFEINDGYKNSIKDVDDVETRITSFGVFEVVNGVETEVTSNYEIDSFETGRLKITPRPLTVRGKSAEFVYDGNEHSLAGETAPEAVEGLADGETVTSVTYTIGITDVGSVSNPIDAIIVSSQLDNYDVTVVDGTLTVTPFGITLTTGTAEKYYDGDPLICNTLTVSGIANAAHTVEKVEESYPSQTNAGERKNVYTCKILAAGDKDVSKNYNFTYVYGTLTVKKTPVIVTLNDGESVEYTGVAQSPDLENPDYFTVAPDLPEEEKEGEEGEGGIKFLLTHEDFAVVSAKAMVDRGEYSYTVRFADKKSYDNYTLSVIPDGVFTITPKKISVETATAKRAYNGAPLFDTGYEVAPDALVSGEHSFGEVKTYASITQKGSTENVFALTVKNAAGADVSYNYDIDYKYGTLTVESREATVMLKKVEELYSGKPVVPDAKKVVQVTVKATPEDTEDVALSGLLLPQDFTVEVDGVALNASDTTYTYGVKIADKTLAENFTLNFTSADGKGEIKINKLPVTVSIRDITQVYNGGEQTVDSYAAIERISDTSTGLTREDFQVVYTGEKDLVNAGRFTYNVSFTRGTAVSGNYDLKVVNSTNKAGDATVYRSKYPVIITSSSDSFVYDAAAHTCALFTNTPLASDKHAIEVSNIDDLPSITDAGSRDNMLTFNIKDTTNGGKSVSGNYDVKVNNGKLTVTQRPITISTGSLIAPYDGEGITCNTVSTNLNLCAGHRAVCLALDENLPKQITVGTLANEFPCAITDSTNANLNGNYLITYVYGTLTVTKREITVHTPSYTGVYDGKAHKGDSIVETTADNLPAGFMLQHKEGTVYTEITEVGEKTNAFECLVLSDETDVTGNFEIKYSYGKLTVTPYNLSLTVVNDYRELKYDGSVQTVAPDVLIIAGMPAGDMLAYDDLEVAYSASIVNAGTYSYTLRFKDVRKANNFTFRSPEGKITVDKCEITLNLNYPEDFTFDNQPKSLTSETVIQSISYAGTLEDLGLLNKSDFVLEFNYAEKPCSEVRRAGEYKCPVAFANASVAQNFRSDGYEFTFMVNPADVTVTLRNYTYTYCGSEYALVASDAVIVSGAVLKADDFVLEVVGGATITDAGTYNYTAEIADSEIKNNFNVQFTNAGSQGVVKVDRLKVKVSLKNYTFEFDNTDRKKDIKVEDAVTCDTALASYEDFSLQFNSGAMRYAGAHKYSVVPKATADFNTDNFTFTYIGGNVTINRHEATVTLANVTKVYDGNAEALGEEHILGVSGNVLDKQSFNLAYVTGTGNESYGLHYFEATLKSTDTNYKNSLSIVCLKGCINVTKRAITVTTASGAKVYDGTPFTFATDANYIEKTENLAAGHTLQVISGKPALTDVGETSNKVNCAVFANGSDVTENYDITYRYGAVKITPKAVTVTTASVSRTYNGEAFTDTEQIATLTGMGGHRAVALGKSPEITDVGAVENVYACKIVNGVGADVTANFTITYVYGKIEVKRATVTVTYKTDVKMTYNGKAFLLTGAEVATLAAGAEGITAADLQVVCAREIKNAGEYSVTVRISDDNLSKNIKLEGDGACTLVVEKSTVGVTLADFKAVYSGKSQTVGSNKLTVGANPDNLKGTDFEVVYYGEMVNAGTYVSGDDTFGVRFVNAANASNYNVEFNGSVEITKADVKLRLNTVTKTYDGRTPSVTEDEAIAGIVCAGNLLTKSDFAVRLGEGKASAEAGEYMNYGFSVGFADASYADNFELTTDTDFNAKYGLVITKRKIVLVCDKIFMSSVNFEMLNDGTGIQVGGYISVSAATPLADGDAISNITVTGYIYKATSSVTIYTDEIMFSLDNAAAYEIVAGDTITGQIVVI